MGDVWGGELKGWSPSNIIFFAPILMTIILHTFQMILSNKIKFPTFSFSAKLFLILLESSETNFDLVACKIGAKLNNLVIYGDIMVNFLRILSIKSIISQKLKIGKSFFHSFENIAQLFETKIQCGHF